MPKAKKTEEKVKKSVVLKEVKPVAKPVKSAAKPKKVEVVEKTAAVEKAIAIEKKASKIVAEVFDLEGKVVENLALPEDIFGVKLNKTLIAQAIRIYRANQRQGNASTKTRGEVQGSTRKIYRQKGTGRARHGSIRAPIFVHGGIVGGPKPRDFSLHLPQKMKRAALFSALSEKLRNGEIKILQGLDKIEPKTKNFVGVIGKLGMNDKKKKILLVTSTEIANIKRAARNVEGVTMTAARRLNTYDILNSRQLLLMKEAIEELKKHLIVNKKSK